jgi:hypothetical protein
VTNTLSKWTKTYFLLLALAFGRVLYESKNSRSEKTEAMHEEVEHIANESLLFGNWFFLGFLCRDSSLARGDSQYPRIWNLPKIVWSYSVLVYSKQRDGS